MNFSHSMTGKEKSNLVSYLGVFVWIVYGILGSRAYWRTAACAGLVIMLAVVATEVRTRSVKIIDCTSLGLFFLVIVAIVSAGEGYFSHYQGIFGWGLFTVVAWAAMIAGVPFSLQYARDRALHELWKKPPSRQVHLRISLAWASIFTLNTFLAAIELIVGHRLLLVVIMPGTSMFLGFAFTVLYPAFHRRQVVNRIETSDVASRVVLDCPLG
jgi:hypothetical protein